MQEAMLQNFFYRNLDFHIIKKSNSLVLQICHSIECRRGQKSEQLWLAFDLVLKSLPSFQVNFETESDVPLTKVFGLSFSFWQHLCSTWWRCLDIHMNWTPQYLGWPNLHLLISYLAKPRTFYTIFCEPFCTLDGVCGYVGRAVASNTRDLWNEFRHFYLLSTELNLYWKDKN